MNKYAIFTSDNIRLCKLELLQNADITTFILSVENKCMQLLIHAS